VSTPSEDGIRNLARPSSARELLALWGADTQTFYADRGIGATRVGFGDRPAVVVVDMAIAFCDPAFKVGANQDKEIGAIRVLLDKARARDIPVFFITTGYGPDGREGGVWMRKDPILIELQEGDPAIGIDPRLAPRASEPVILKRFTSSFFQTTLHAQLVEAGVDTVIVTGCSTSGCIRATVVDGVSHGYRMIVPHECVGDRAEGPHWANLFDIDAKYGDVVDQAEVFAYFESRGARR
jgi:nicotinamidase-related amidase